MIMPQKGERFRRRAAAATTQLTVSVLASSRPVPSPGDRCFACGRPMGCSPAMVDTADGRYVFVGRSCASLIAKAGDAGYDPPTGGPTLYLL